MPDATDSYCERCGTRYLFRPAAPKGPSLKGARVLAKGLKNFVLTDGQSMGESLALARTDDDHEDSARMTAEFYRTFNFCMTCRQYACDTCWNEKQGACLTCSPEAHIVPMAAEDHLIVRTPVMRYEANSPRPLGHAADPAPLELQPETVRPSWPTADLLVSMSGSEGEANGDDRRESADVVESMAWAGPIGSADWTLWPVSEARESATTGSEALHGSIAQVAAEANDGATLEADVTETVSTGGAEWQPEVAVAAFVPPPGDGQELALTPQELLLVEAQLGQTGPDGIHLAPEPIYAPEQATATPLSLAEAPTPAALRDATAGDTIRTAASWEPELPAQLAHMPDLQPSEPWPHATRWSERPLETHDWFDDAIASETASPAVAAQFEPQPTALDLAPAADIRAAAPAQVSPGLDTEDQRSSDAANPGRPDATSWPPLGASWQPQAHPGRPWEVPADTHVPAIIAATKAPQPPAASMWAQSSQEVLNRGSVRVCHKCALPVSTHAKFCRRCGTQQA